VIAKFFVDRPIFACVLSIVITLAGGVAVVTLPLAQFPNISPPNVSVSAVYPGASAKDVAGAVAAPIEQQVNGVEGMLYMSSSCTNDGGYSLTVTFQHGVNLDMAQVLVQNRVSLAVPMLPDVIKQTGVSVRKRSPDVLMGIAITSPGARYDQLYLSNYATMRIRDELIRIEGVSDIRMMGQRNYSMRVWLDPAALSARNMTAGDVVAAIREQNSEVAIGTIGTPP
jgi:multidrug efflux pump subunit AcrB